jgi:hypothetical protein
MVTAAEAAMRRETQEHEFAMREFKRRQLNRRL